MMPSNCSHIVRINCSDEPGLIHKVTGALFERGCNITTNHEFVERETGRFFMRMGFETAASIADLRPQLLSLLPEGSEVHVTAPSPKKIVVLVTREPHCLGDLLVRCAFQEMPAEILAVVANRPALRKLTQSFDKPFHLVDSDGIQRAEHEAAIGRVLDEYSPDYLVLAKYMRILSPEFVARWKHRMVNIHHSFLPAFTGSRPYRQAFKRGVKIIGATAHFVTPELDEGPIICQDVTTVDHRHRPKEMAAAGKDVEKTVLARALKWVLEDRVFVSGNKTVIFD